MLMRFYSFGVNLTFLPSISPPPYKEFAQVVIDEGVKVAETGQSRLLRGKNVTDSYSY